MRSWLTRRWYQPRPAPLGLRPLAALYGLIAAQRRRRLQAEAARVRLRVPVIVVGNLSVGGTGKTPFVLWLVDRLREWGWRPGVISRGYGGRAAHYPLRVSADSDPAEVGDEPALIAWRSGVPVVVDPDRLRAARALDAEVDVLIADDGLQHYRLPRQVEIVVVDGQRGFGNGALLPAGPLREPISRLAEVDLVVVNGGGLRVQGPPCVDMQLPGAHAFNLREPSRVRALRDFRGESVHAMAGIGHPERFFQLLEREGLHLVRHPFADHQAYQPAQIEWHDSRPVLMTEKDAVKCRHWVDARYWSVPVTAQLDPAATQRVRESLLSRLTSFP
ncbi:MAG TPA: tetraacyldisaccharide 4'-kinase [Nevskiaceae bacterium]|nr:tetraacyldisaccharide 4'-kinase [Nevskiaceae bacterium]